MRPLKHYLTSPWLQCLLGYYIFFNFRPQKQGEIQGQDYYFASRLQIQNDIEKVNLIELINHLFEILIFLYILKVTLNQP